MNQFIGKKNEIIKFLKKKGFLIKRISAAFISVGIIAGIVVGIIELYKHMSQQCLHFPGTVYNNTLKKCVPQKCPGNMPVCESKTSEYAGSCIPEKYCPTVSGGTSYTYDADTCECKLVCSVDGEIGYTKDGKNTTSMTLEKGLYEPKNELTCGKACQYNDGKDPSAIGGLGWCPPGSTCGQYINQDGIDERPGLGCYDDTFKKCTTETATVPVVRQIVLNNVPLYGEDFFKATSSGVTIDDVSILTKINSNCTIIKADAGLIQCTCIKDGTITLPGNEEWTVKFNASDPPQTTCA